MAEVKAMSPTTQGYPTLSQFAFLPFIVQERVSLLYSKSLNNHYYLVTAHKKLEVNYEVLCCIYG
jgi:hypothetical protein